MDEDFTNNTVVVWYSLYAEENMYSDTTWKCVSEQLKQPWISGFPLLQNFPGILLDPYLWVMTRS